MDMVEVVVALLMMLMVRLKNIDTPSMSNCLKGKRIAMRTNNSKSVEYQCIKSKAETEIYMGAKSIKKLILE